MDADSYAVSASDIAVERLADSEANSCELDVDVLAISSFSDFNESADDVDVDSISEVSVERDSLDDSDVDSI